MKTGISVYFSDGIPYNESLIERAHSAGASYAFTSLHIPEELGIDYRRDARYLLGLLRDFKIAAIVDVGPDTCEKLGCSNLASLHDLGVEYIRLDYGFSPRETVELSQMFHIVCNASTVTKAEIAAWRSAGADFSRFAACHNFYPKPFTGLSVEAVREMNNRLGAAGFDVIGFVPGDAHLRGPLHEGLPMIEEQRSRRGDLARNMLEAAYGCGCDIVLVGDPGLTDASWNSFHQLAQGYVDLRAQIDEPYSYLYEQIHHDRPDSSSWVIRSQESRTTLKPADDIDRDTHAGMSRRRGSIAVSNSGYLRYQGELEIARQDLPGDDRMNIVGQIDLRDECLLPFIKNGYGFRLVRA